MTLYSWTGISRTSGVEKKLPFQVLDGVQNILYDIIKKADCRWTEAMNIKLFKDKVLKHSKKIEEVYEKNKKKKVIGENMENQDETEKDRKHVIEDETDNE